MMEKIYIKCKMCGKEIEKKGTREYCVKCTNIRNRELAKKYRDEHPELMRERQLKCKAKYAAKKKQLERDY